MTFLLDTHVWLWMLTDPERLRPTLLDELTDVRTRVMLSAASAWEIAIKYALGRLALPESPETYVPSRLQQSGVLGLAVEHAHALRVASLPHHHRDPFDRLLIAQAQVEGTSIVSDDPAFQAYDVSVIAATPTSLDPGGR